MVEMLLECQESCIINGGNTTIFFKLQKGARQGDPVSVFFKFNPLFLMLTFQIIHQYPI